VTAYAEVVREVYGGALWAETQIAPAPSLARLLASRDRLVVLTSGAPPFRVVLGVPHHAAAGCERICERRRDAQGRVRARTADEDAALYALVAFDALRAREVPCKLVVMAHPTTHDPNKRRDSPYCREIFADPLGLLLECHGSAPRRALDLELSAGCNHLADAPGFGAALAAALDHAYVLGVQRRPGDAAAWIFRPGGVREAGNREVGVLALPATCTTSLMEAERRRVPALHLEAKPRFRRPDDDRDVVTPDGRRLGRALARVIASS
jgi:hypothetical protein